MDDPQAVDGDRLYVGGRDRHNEEDYDFVLNLSYRCKASYTTNQSYAHLPIRDDTQINHRDFNQACTLLKTRYTLYADEEILVHCQSGVSRSITVTAAVLAKIQEKDFTETLERIQQIQDLDHDPEPTLEALAAHYAETDQTL